MDSTKKDLLSGDDRKELLGTFTFQGEMGMGPQLIRNVQEKKKEHKD